MPDRLPLEPDDSYAIFLRYCELGSVAAAGKAAGVPYRTAARWARRWEWKERAREYQRSVSLEAVQAEVERRTPELRPLIGLCDLAEVRDRVKVRLAELADEAAITLSALAHGELPPGDCYQTGKPKVPPAVQLAAARALLEILGATPPKRVELSRKPDNNYQLLREAAARMTPEEKSTMRRAFERLAGAGQVEATAENV